METTERDELEGYTGRWWGISPYEGRAWIVADSWEGGSFIIFDCEGFFPESFPQATEDGGEERGLDACVEGGREEAEVESLGLPRRGHLR